MNIEILKFKNAVVHSCDLLGRVIRLKKGDIEIKDRFLRAESNDVFKIGKLKTKKRSLKQFELIGE